MVMELHLRAVSARNLLDKQTFGRQDPYCKISVGRKMFKTRVHDNGHKSPVWKEKFVFEVYDPQLDQIYIQVKDKNFTASVLIGESRLPVSMFTHGNLVDQWFPLNNGSKRAGEINLRVQLIGQGMGKPPKAQPYPTQPYPQAVPASSYPSQGYAQQPATSYAQQQQWQIQQQRQAQFAHQQAQMASMYAAAPPVAMAPSPPAVMAPTPVVMGPPPTVVYSQPMMYGGGYHRHHHRYHGGGDAGGIAMGVGAGVLGGMLLGEVLFD